MQKKSERSKARSDLVEGDGMILYFFCVSMRSPSHSITYVFARFLTIFVFVLVFENHLRKGDFQKIRGFFGDEIGRFQSDDFI